ncbi:hypothetical protein [Aeoliella sp.]|uniref:hypothetical protein n=1 Tax=Aeoliella sp. TaxID=2795800 RepID=UPI003CCBE828
MLPKRLKTLSALLVWTTALGMALTVFAVRPPCRCSLSDTQPAEPACPHCAKAVEQSCCQQGCSGATQSDCECPCCHSSHADQPLILDLAKVPQPVDIGADLFLEAADYTNLFTSPAVATGGWRCGQLDGYHPPRLANLCRWII